MTYDPIAPFYDTFNGDFSHSDYLSEIEKFLKPYVTFPFGDCAALDCGCGTGELTRLLAAKGFDCTGVDISPAMLSEAAAKDDLKNCRFVIQSLPEIDMFRAYDLVTCCLDTVNHLFPDDLAEFFSRIYNFTENGGFFVFDTKTRDEFIRRSNSATYGTEDAELFYKGSFRQPVMTTRLRLETDEGRTETEIKEYFYTNRQIKRMIASTPFVYIGRFSYNRGERTVFVCRKNQQ